MKDKLKTKLAALLRLSREGVGNEKSTAESLLLKHLKSANITFEEFVNEPELVSKHVFKYEKNRHFDQQLLVQIFCQVLNSPDHVAYRYRSNNHLVPELGVQCTKQQAAEITLRQSLYRRALQEELRLTSEAFVQQNSIFRTNTKDEPGSVDLKELEKILNRMACINPTPVHKQISSNQE